MNPTPLLRPDEILAHVDLSVREAVLGPEGEFRWVRQAGITFGRPIVYLNSVDSFPPSFQSRPDAARWGYATVVFPFDLEDPPRGRAYVDATIRVWLAHEDAVALNLQPNGLMGGRDRLPLDTVRVRVWGYGRDTFAWALTDAAGGVLEPGGHVVRAVIQYPPSLDTLPGRAAARLTLRVPRLGGLEDWDLETPSEQPFTLSLRPDATQSTVESR